MNNTSEEMERRVEATRAEVDRTAEALKEKASPSALMDEVVRTFREKGGSDMLSNLGTQVKDNPLPLAMIGAGMAWLMMGSNSSSSSSTTARRSAYDGPDAYPPGGLYGADTGTTTAYAGDYSQSGSDKGLKDKAADALGSAKSKVSGAAHSVSDKASSAASSAKEGLSSAAHGAAERASGTASQVSETFRNVAQQEPFVIGALGLALGAAIGAALPSTEFEDRHLGQFRDKALEKGKDAVKQAKEVAGSAVQSAKDEADRQGVTDETRSFMEKAEKAVRAGVDTAKEEAKNRTNA